MESQTSAKPASGLESIQLFDQVQKCFKTACLQVSVLEDRLNQLMIRYERSKTHGHDAFQKALKWKLITVRNVRDMYETYALRKAEQLMELTAAIEHGLTNDLEQLLLN